MTTIEEQRAAAVSKLAELSEIKKPIYSARELRQQRGMLARVQRKERKRHMERVETQKIKLRKDITDIDRYLQGLNDRPTVIFGPKPLLKKSRLKRYKRKSKYKRSND